MGAHSPIDSNKLSRVIFDQRCILFRLGKTNYDFEEGRGHNPRLLELWPSEMFFTCMA